MEKARRWRFYFNTTDEAMQFYRAAAQIAENYDYVTLEDLYDLAGDDGHINCEELLERRNIKWTFDEIDPDRASEYVGITVAYDRPMGYVVKFYEVKLAEAKANDICQPITITVKIPNITCGMISDLINKANKVKDRPVNLVIIDDCSGDPK